jgi:hypothetical protein
MLKYKYRLRVDDSSEEIKLDDFYISSDLSYISGTTNDKYAISKGDKVSISSAYFPKLITLPVTYIESVKRNGYIGVKKELDIYTLYYKDKSWEEIKDYVVKYVEYNGNVYYQDTSNKLLLSFYIDGVVYQEQNDALKLSIIEKAYIENNKVTIDDIEYDVILDKNNNNVLFIDSAGYSFKKLDSWDISHVSYQFEFVKKIAIGNNNDLIIDYTSLTRYGYKPYISYKGYRKPLKPLIDSNGEFEGIGVVAGGTNYFCNCIEETESYDDDTNGYLNNIYDKNAYMKNDNGYATMEINGAEHIISFEPMKVNNGKIICIESKQENLPILIGDTIIADCNNANQKLIVKTDGDERYVVFNGVRYKEIDNLLDTVIINDNEYQISYSGDSEYPYVGMIATCTLDDDSVMYFKVTNVDDNYHATSVKKVDYNDGKFSDSYTVKYEDSTLVYDIAPEYKVTNYSGFIINNRKCKINQVYTNKLVDSENNTEEEVLSYEYVLLVQSYKYKLNVIDTVGNNKILCNVEINPNIYEKTEYRNLIDEAITLLSTNDCILTKKENAFGTTDLEPISWCVNAINASGYSSTYELSDIQNNIQILKTGVYLTFPITLSNNNDYSHNQDDLVTLYHYNEKEDEYINELVDMEKDMYMPVIMDSNNSPKMINSIEFNLHFRTRDLDNNWQIYQDGETNDSGVNSSINHKMSNWFITDYYSYNRKKDIFEFNKLVKLSDLLGFLYFTTDDVKYQQKKLTNSFLRLTYYDSKNPNTQNMLGTSTIFFDTEKYYNVIYGNKPSYCFFEDVSQYDNEDSDWIVNYDYGATVLSERYTGIFDVDTISSSFLGNNVYFDYDYTGDRLDSKLVANNPYIVNSGSNESFNAYILKYFANKEKKQTIYLMFEFFHAGKGSRLPFIIPTDENNKAISNWTQSNLDKFKEGYALNDIYRRLYVPIEISYNNDLRRFVYNISDDNNYAKAIVNGDKLVFNLFELKTKTSYTS